MLRNVIDAYLAGLKFERDLDAPFIALLNAMGFRDVHLVHGSQEKGKDFIAKSPDLRIQYVFQSKKGNIGVSEWRKDVLSQLTECATTGLQHPSFDATLKRQIVLVTSGTLSQEANDRAKDFGVGLKRLKCLPLKVWSRPKLVELFLEHGSEGLRGVNDQDVETFGRFLILYGKAVRGEATSLELELHSQSWIPQDNARPQELVIAASEGAILASKLQTANRPYESLVVELCGLRAILAGLFYASDSGKQEFLKQLHGAQIERAIVACKHFIEVIEEEWHRAEENFDRVTGGPYGIITYPVACMRAIEAIGLLFFLDPTTGEAMVSLLERLITKEPGCAHPVGDRYAVSLVLATLALLNAGKKSVALSLLKDAAIWVADCYDRTDGGGFGLGGVDDSVEAELEQFLGWPFAFLKITRDNSSLLATAILDLTAFAGARELYSDIVNDFLAVGICPTYYQTSDTDSQFFVEGSEMLLYPNIAFEDTLPSDGTLTYADHVRHELREYRVASEVGVPSYLGLSLLLRDRWFVGIWPSAQT